MTDSDDKSRDGLMAESTNAASHSGLGIQSAGCGPVLRGYCCDMRRIGNAELPELTGLVRW